VYHNTIFQISFVASIGSTLHNKLFLKNRTVAVGKIFNYLCFGLITFQLTFEELAARVFNRL